jgi:hypothetical protein
MRLCIRVVKIIAGLELEQKLTLLKGLDIQSSRIHVGPSFGSSFLQVNPKEALAFIRISNPFVA